MLLAALALVVWRPMASRRSWSLPNPDVGMARVRSGVRSSTKLCTSERCRRRDASSALRRGAILTTLLVAAERLWTLLHAPPTDFDDAYMFLRYAHNLIDGYGLRWNRGEPPVYGATSLPHVLVVALVRWARPALSDAAVLQISSGVAAVLLVVALVLTCARFAQHPSLRRQGWFWGALLVSLLAYTEPFQFHARERHGHHAGRAGQHRPDLRGAGARGGADDPARGRDRSRRVPGLPGAGPTTRSTRCSFRRSASRLSQPLAASRRPLIAFAATLSVAGRRRSAAQGGLPGYAGSARRLGQAPALLRGLRRRVHLEPALVPERLRRRARGPSSAR